MIKFGQFWREFQASREAENLSESFKTVAIPTKILGTKEDYIINYISIDKFEIFNKDGDFVSVEKSDSLFKTLKEIFDASDKIKFREYKTEYSTEHNKWYSKNDWDSDLVIVKLPAETELPISKIKSLFI